MAPDPAERLHERGFRVTAQRLAVLHAVTAHPHASVDEITDSVRTELGDVSVQAVYDALGVLVQVGLLRRIQPAGSPARFEDRVDDNHHHLVCRVCGRVVDVDCATGDTPCLTASHDHGFEIDEAEVAYWGRCPDCTSRARTPSGPAARRRRGRRSASL